MSAPAPITSDGPVVVVLFNLGGPDGPAAVRPFLYNLFRDPAIIRLPPLLRQMVAWLIARRRAPLARRTYGLLGGSSPLLANTRAQARALEAALNQTYEGKGEGENATGFRVLVAMRYWHPFAGETAREVAALSPSRLLLLPLYPQCSTTTTGSSLIDWRRAARQAGLRAPQWAYCCWPQAKGFAALMARRIDAACRELATGPETGTDAPSAQGVRILFSAHGLPERVVAAGDPYAWQVERTAAAIRAAMATLLVGEGETGATTDWVVCYQSRVGPLEWIGPSTEAEIARAAADGKSVVVVPLSFVSEHVETLVELDKEYAALAARLGVSAYRRVAAGGDDPEMIDALATLVRGLLAAPPGCYAGAAGGTFADRQCPSAFSGCLWGKED